MITTPQLWSAFLAIRRISKVSQKNNWTGLLYCTEHTFRSSFERASPRKKRQIRLRGQETNSYPSIIIPGLQQQSDGNTLLTFNLRQQQLNVDRVNDAGARLEYGLVFSKATKRVTPHARKRANPVYNVTSSTFESVYQRVRLPSDQRCLGLCGLPI